MKHQDLISDVLNKIMNAKRAGKKEIEVSRFSKLLIEILKIGKKEGYIKKYEVKDKKLHIEFELNECRAIRPRYYVNLKNMEKYIRRFLPARNFGVVIISTNQGLMTHRDANEKKIGGSLIAYMF